MKRTRIIGLGIALLLVLAVLVIWIRSEPCDAPSEVCEKFDAIQDLDGISSVKLDYEKVATDPKAGERAKATWTVTLRENQQDQEAIEAALRAEQLLQSVLVPHVDLQTYSQFVLGQIQDIATEQNTGQFYPLNIFTTESLQADLEQAFVLKSAGALFVTNSSVVAADRQSLRELAELALQQNYLVSFETQDHKVRYTPEATIDLDALTLASDASELPNVETSIFGSQMLSVHSSSPDSTVETRRIQQWLDQRSPPHQKPLKYSVSSPGYAKILEGWVGQVLPAELTPSPAPLPKDTTSWPRDPKAAYCTADDIEFRLSTPDAALGSRYLSIYATNISTAPCALQGVPTIEFFNRAGEPQKDISITADPSIDPEVLLVPEGETAMAAMKWAAMSTTNDPDESRYLELRLLPGLEAVKLTPQVDGQNTTLDVLDGASIRLSPWVQALEGWAKPHKK